MSAAPGIRFYFSFRSPFAAIAFYRLRRAPQFNAFEFELLPVWPDNIFGGHMDNPTDNIFKMAYIFDDAARQADLAGIDPQPFQALAKAFQLPEQADYASEKVGFKMPDEHWEIPHMAFHYAAQRGLGWQFGDAVFTRRFNLDGAGGVDVMDRNVIETIANDMGLDGAAAAGVSETGEFDADQQRISAMGERDGVFGVPFFVVEQDNTRQTFWGNDRLEYLLRALTGCERLPEISKDQLRKVQRG